ncbi:MAG: hypothetical protein ACI8RY_001932 [Urechidicola sp.]|jgi:hypothetical protein
MKIKILSLFFLVLPIFLNAQNAKVDWGEVHKFPKRNVESPFIGISDNHYFLNYKKKKSNTLMVYNFDHELVHEIPLGRNQDDKRIIAESIIKTKTGYFLITSAYYKKEKIEFVYTSAIEEDGSVNFTADHLFAYSLDKGQGITLPRIDLYNRDKYGFTISPDSTKLLFTRVTGIYQDLRIAGKEKYQLFVFDQSFGKVWDKIIDLPNVDSKINVDKFSITNNGNVLLFASNVEKKRRFKNWIPSYSLSIFRVNKDGIFAQIDLSVSDSYPVNAIGFCDEEGSLYIAGIYTNALGSKKEIGANGTFMMKFDKANKMLFSKKHPFDLDIKDAIRPTGVKRGAVDFFKFDIDLLLVDFTNERFLFVAENRYFSMDREDFHSDDILIPNFSFDGEVNWIYHYPKRYKSDYLKKISSMIFMKENKIFLFHHCFKSKEERKALRLEQGYKFSSYFTDLVAINLSGELESKKTLFNLSGFNRRHINTKFCRILNDGRILIYTNDTDKFRFGTYKID